MRYVTPVYHLLVPLVTTDNSVTDTKLAMEVEVAFHLEIHVEALNVITTVMKLQTIVTHQVELFAMTDFIVHKSILAMVMEDV